MRLYSLFTCILIAAASAAETTLSAKTTICTVTRTTTITAPTALTQKYFASRGTPGAASSSKKSTTSSKSTVTAACASSTSTVVTTVTVYRAVTSCGVPISASAKPTSGLVTCPAGTNGEVNEYTRIESDVGTGVLFEGCIQSAPGIITTKSGGSHKCDGTNNNTNPHPGATALTQLNAVAKRLNVSFDGTWSSVEDDFDITVIDGIAEQGYTYWALTVNQLNTPGLYGCSSEVHGNAEELLWAYYYNDDNNDNYILHVTPGYAVVAAGTKTVSIKVTGNDGYGYVIPIQHAKVQDGISSASDSHGNISISVPAKPGCYQYKVFYNDEVSIRSNIFYLTVV